MNKKGFTLVELLAVIAILTILVIIALPNVIKLYNNAKKNTFLTEAKTIYKEAANKYITESMKGNKVSYISSNTKNSLELNGSKDIEYKIRLNSDGSVRRFQVKNNSYCINGKYNDANELIIDDVTEKECAEIDASYCKSNLDTLETGSEVIIGKYTYKYKQGYGDLGWANLKEDGWGVILTDKESTDDITEVPCTFIDDKPIISLGYTFHSSKAKNIDLSGINTSHVTDMNFMFGKTKASIINLNDFDTSNVGGFTTGMRQMFNSAEAHTIYGLEYFDTSKVTDMYFMFAHTSIDNLNLSNFDTSNVTSMGWMFRSAQYNSLDLSDFDTSNVKSFNGMFYGCNNLKTIYVSDKFNTLNVNDSDSMFDSVYNLVGGSGTVYDHSKTDKTYARIDGGTSNPGYFTLKTN